jgi:secreted Zn-dependent insulinase-like peptidase
VRYAALLQGSITISFKSPAAYADPEAAVMTKLFARLLSDALNEIA